MDFLNCDTGLHGVFSLKKLVGRNTCMYSNNSNGTNSALPLRDLLKKSLTVSFLHCKCNKIPYMLPDRTVKDTYIDM